MIRKILKMQFVKLFDSAEYVGFNLLGSVLVIVFGWGVLLMGGGAADRQEQFCISMYHSFPALLVLCICMAVYTLAREHENRTINYEVTYGAAVHKIMIGRMLAPVINTIIFVLVILGIELILHCVDGGCLSGIPADIFSRTIFNFICVLHLNIISGLYFAGTGSVSVSCVIIVLTQCFFPMVLERIHISDLLCASQYHSLWGDDMSETFVYKVVGSFLAETVVVFCIVCVWSYRRDWK